MRAYAMQIEILNFIELLDLGLLELVTCELQIRPELGLIPSIAELELSFSKSNLNRLIEFMSLQFEPMSSDGAKNECSSMISL